MKNLIDSLFNKKSNLDRQNRDKQLESINPLDTKLLYFADLFYNEKFPTIEFTFREVKQEVDYFMGKEDQYFGSWVVGGDDLKKIQEIFIKISPSGEYTLRDTHRIAAEMNKMDFEFRPIEGEVVAEPFKTKDGKHLYKAKVINS
jgi:hypothetical protein